MEYQMEYQMEHHLAAIQQRIGMAPDALAVIRGAADVSAGQSGLWDAEGACGQAGQDGQTGHPQCAKGPCGVVYFFQEADGVLVMADVHWLPKTEGNCGGDFYGFHIHENGSCSGMQAAPFQNAGGHFNPDDCPHPYHAGDLLPLYGTKQGRAFLLFFTDRFSVEDVIGRTVIVHGGHDDFTTQPSGNAGAMIGCGRIFAG